MVLSRCPNRPLPLSLPHYWKDRVCLIFPSRTKRRVSSYKRPNSPIIRNPRGPNGKGFLPRGSH